MRDQPEPVYNEIGDYYKPSPAANIRIVTVAEPDGNDEDGGK